MTQQVKNPSAVQETQEMWVRSLGREDPLEEGMAAHSSIFAWETPQTEEPGGLQSMGSPQSDMAECTALTHKGSSGRSQKTIYFKVVLHNPPLRRKKGKERRKGRREKPLGLPLLLRLAHQKLSRRECFYRQPDEIWGSAVRRGWW